MSADLWAAFGSPQETGGQSQLPKAASDSPSRGPSIQSRLDTDDERWETDSWSAVNEELENAWSGTGSGDPFAQHAASKAAINPPAAFPFTAPAEDEDFGDFEEAEAEALPTPAAPRLLANRLPEKVMEKANDDEDDFGDFAEVEPEPRYKDPFPSQDHGALAGLRSDAQHLHANTSGLDSLIDFDGSMSGASDAASSAAAPKQPRPKETPVLRVDSDSENNEDWDDFGPSPINSRAIKGIGAKASKLPAKPISKSAPDGSSSSAKRIPPPVNIPPPSVLISLICGFLPEFPEKVRVTIVETWDEDEADISKPLNTLRVTARILAGRKLRWKRDSILAQSMRIGMSGRPGGMKLAGVDRAEVQREDREAAELVRTWRQHLGAIRTALAESSNTTAKAQPLPAITEAPLVRTAKQDEGGITAARCCVLCGLKREERVDKVDTAVWDQFGEWWTEHWGHSSCKAFWEEYEPQLQQR